MEEDEALILHFRYRHQHMQSSKLSAGVFGLRLGGCKLHVVFSDQLDSIWLAAAFSGRCFGAEMIWLLIPLRILLDDK